MWHRRRTSDPVRLAGEVVRRLGRRLRGRTHDGVQVVALLHYGAVEIDHRHLAVWLLLDGRPAGELPEWLRIDPADMSGAASVDPAWLLTLRAEVCDAFRAVGWPDPDTIHVLVDSADRVQAGGGWNYFRG